MAKVSLYEHILHFGLRVGSEYVIDRHIMVGGVRGGGGGDKGPLKFPYYSIQGPLSLFSHF
jgi:hypothetical protein